MKKLLTIVALLVVAVPVFAQQTRTFGWDGVDELALGYYGTPVNEGEMPILASLDADMAYAGSHGLMLVDNAESGTPQLYAAAVYGLQAGDMVDVSLMVFTPIAGQSPRCRIWGHYNNSLGTPEEDINGYDGSASGPAYAEGEGWDVNSFTYEIPEGITGLIIEIRTYSVAGDTSWADELTITAPDDAIIRFPGEGPVAVQSQTWTGVKNQFN
jgi:hypothetical protein